MRQGLALLLYIPRREIRGTNQYEDVFKTHAKRLSACFLSRTIATTRRLAVVVIEVTGGQRK